MKVLSIVFVFLFGCIIATPLIFIDTKSTVSETEKRPLSNIPVSPLIRDGKLNAEYLTAMPKTIDNYLNDRFAFRKNYIALMSDFDYFVMRKKHNKSVLAGKDNWLFYIKRDVGNSFSDFFKQNLLTDTYVQAIIDKIAEVSSFCEEQGIVFLCLIAPEKHAVYPEKYPFPQPTGLSRTDQIMNALGEGLREQVLYPRDYLISKKAEHTQPLFYPSGTHWNQLGAYYVSQLIYDKLKPVFPDIPKTEYQFTAYPDAGEDSIAYLALNKKRYETPFELLNVEPVDNWENHYRYLKRSMPRNTDANGAPQYAEPGRYNAVTENRDSGLPRALVFRDSYFLTLEPFTSCIFSFAEYVWDDNSKKNYDYIRSRKPDVFIWEFGERGLGQVPTVSYGGKK
ncbi:MAG: hypothetical protein LBT16_10740 [Treponema sp.]|nr:hypothetical protein [Treponema sp.]